MIAVIETGGKQYIVKQGDVITVDRLDESTENHTFTPLLIADDKGGTKVGAPAVDGAKVECKVVEHTRGDKVRVFQNEIKKTLPQNNRFPRCTDKTRSNIDQRVVCF
jgi:large subunit ribosomal protein L21